MATRARSRSRPPLPRVPILCSLTGTRLWLTDRARAIVKEAATNSTRVQYTRIEVNGYTDTSGTPALQPGPYRSAGHERWQPSLYGMACPKARLRPRALATPNSWSPPVQVYGSHKSYVLKSIIR